MNVFESQRTISEWADGTFGKSTNLAVAIRARKELNELIAKLEENDLHSGAGEEVADIQIVLARISHQLGVDGAWEIQKKMEINRKRKWVRDGTGNGQHV